MNNIQNVLRHQLCTGCGICSNICPAHCISTSLSLNSGYYETNISETSCFECGACQKVCPIYTWSNETELFVGRVLGTYSGYSSNATLRKECASGGITTALLLYLLRTGMIDAAVVAYRPADNPLESRLKIVYTENDIVASKGSVYSPTSYTSIVSEILESDKSHFAVVGLPCHIEGITSLCKYKKKLAEKIVFKIALVCGHTPSIQAYDYSLRHLQIERSDVKVLSNRGDGWPGYMKIWTNSSEPLKIRYGHQYSWGMCLSSCVFTPPGCRHCIDATGYQADISICDAWLEKYNGDKIGRNLFVVRNAELLEIVKQMAFENEIVINEEDPVVFIKANHRVFVEKLSLNGYKNDKFKKEGLYEKVTFLNQSNFVAQLIVRLYVGCEKYFHKLFGQNKANYFILFSFKMLKYLALKWARIKY